MADTGPPPQVMSAESEDVPAEGFGQRPVLTTTAICALFGMLGHIVIWVAEVEGWIGRQVFWEPVVGVSLIGVSVTAFGGFFVAARRARIAIAASFLLTFFVALTYVLTIESLAGAAEQGAAQDLFNDFRSIVVAIVGFYFGAETIVSVAKIWGVSRTPEAQGSPVAIQRADRDLVTPSPRRP